MTASQIAARKRTAYAVYYRHEMTVVPNRHILWPRRRGGRVAEGGGLLNRWRRKLLPGVRIPSPPPFIFLVEKPLIYIQFCNWMRLCLYQSLYQFVWVLVMGFVVKRGDKYSAWLVIPKALRPILDKTSLRSHSQHQIRLKQTDAPRLSYCAGRSWLRTQRPMALSQKPRHWDVLDNSHNNALLDEDGFWESTKTGIIEDAIEDIILGGRDIESLTSFDIVFQILINRLARPAEREGRALRI